MYCETRRRRRTAFTLVELMVVVVIIGMLAAAVTFSVRSYLVAGRQNVAKMEIAKIVQAIETFYTAYDRYPTNEEGLEILAQSTEKFQEGILNKVPKDPWGRPYQYNHPGRNRPFEVVSFGADGREGGEGAEKDLLSWQLEN